MPPIIASHKCMGEGAWEQQLGNLNQYSKDTQHNGQKETDNVVNNELSEKWGCTKVSWKGKQFMIY